MMQAPPILLTEQETLVRKFKAKKTLLWFGIISVVMLFGALTSAYIVRQAEGKWVQFDMPNMFIASTVVILLSSIPMQWAVVSARKNNQKNLKLGLLLVSLLGAAFVVFQFFAWSELFSKGIAFAGQIKDIKGEYTYIRAGNESPSDINAMGNVAGSFLYVITALHVLHLLAGIIVLIIVFSHALKGKYSSSNYNGISMCATYWHFLDALWVYLFFFLLYIR